MNDKDFFKYYIPALETSLAYENTEAFDVKGPDWFVEDEVTRNALDLFEQENYERFQALFDMVAYYLDAKAHNFPEINGISLADYKQRLELEIEYYKEKYAITIGQQVEGQHEHHCRVCGLYTEEVRWEKDNTSPTYEICACCGAESGNDDYTVELVKAYREKWLGAGAVWFYEKHKPENWDIHRQMVNIPETFKKTNMERPNFEYVRNFIDSVIGSVDNVLDKNATESVRHYLVHDEYEMAFEGLFIEIMSLRKVPEIDVEKCEEVGLLLKLDKESVFDHNFWEKFMLWRSLKN